MPAATIDDCISLAADNIAAITYGAPPPPTISLLAQMNAWIDGMFGSTGVFPPAQNLRRDPGQRLVTDWLYAHLAARDSIEGPLPGDAGLLSASDCINAVVRGLCAVKYAQIDGEITAAQQNAVVALFNTVWP